MVMLQKILGDLLKKNGLTITEVAKESGVPMQTLHGWSIGKNPTNLAQLKKIANYFNISLHYLLFGELDPHEALSTEVLKEIFSGDVRVTIHKVEKKK